MRPVPKFETYIFFFQKLIAKIWKVLNFAPVRPGPYPALAIKTATILELEM